MSREFEMKVLNGVPYFEWSDGEILITIEYSMIPGCIVKFFKSENLDIIGIPIEFENRDRKQAISDAIDFCNKISLRLFKKLSGIETSD